MKDISSPPAVSDEFRNSLKRCLEKAALINYGNLTAEVRLDGKRMFSLYLFVIFCEQTLHILD